MPDKDIFYNHFEGKSALEHITSVQADGLETSLEIHGAEAPGTLFSCLDAARETLMLTSFLSILLDFFEHPSSSRCVVMFALISAWSFWKGARATWISWMRLERLHRIAGEERQEIAEHREQEKQELSVLYRAKGLSGSLLAEVVDIFMADEERALRVMLEEEMGLRLNQNAHPLLMGLSAFIGSISMLAVGLVATIFLSQFQMISLCASLSFFLGYIYAYYEKNSAIKAGCWSSAVSITACVIFSTLLKGSLNV
ncbi:MAG: VIT1/CCC1 transporter family protein [Chlamydia sp.]